MQSSGYTEQNWGRWGTRPVSCWTCIYAGRRCRLMIQTTAWRHLKLRRDVRDARFSEPWRQRRLCLQRDALSLHLLPLVLVKGRKLVQGCLQECLAVHHLSSTTLAVSRSYVQGLDRLDLMHLLIYLISSCLYSSFPSTFCVFPCHRGFLIHLWKFP